MNESKYYATGKRKNAVARVWLEPGEGRITVNNRSADDYFSGLTLTAIIKQPFVAVNVADKFNVTANISGGGVVGQAQALRHGISKGLLEVDASYRITLKKKGFISRDSREKERKKYGQKGARKKFQYSKR